MNISEKMERAIVGFLMLIGLLMLLPANFSLAQKTTMCISQFALANQACSVLPSEQALGSRNHTLSLADADSGGGSGDDGDEDGDEDDSRNNDGEDNDGEDNDDEGEGESERRLKRGHGKKKKKKGRKQRKHGRKHKRGGEHDDEPRANKDCCRWLEELDESCVCGALLRLPPFLVKTTHMYSIKVGKSCKFTYNCNGI